MRNISVVLFSVFAIMIGTAQTAIKGTVKDSQGNPVPLANIKVLNSDLGTATDKDGIFSLELAASSNTLIVSAIGYATQYLVIEEESEINIMLLEATTVLGDVVVSARKREETLVSSPISVSFLNSKAIEDTQTRDLGGLTAIVPNYLYQEAGVPFQAIQSIRGIQVFSENPAVATYIDDVNQLDILANGFALTDIERIEVLRGPQGTLFGRNAMGGVINIVTKQPGNKTEGFGEIGFGNLNLQRHSFGLRTPLIANKLFFGFTGLFQDRNGYWENDASLASVPNPSLDGETVGDYRNLYGNLSLKWLASKRLTFSLNVKSQKDWSNASGFFVSQPNEEIAFENPDKIYLSRLGSHNRNIVNTALVAKYFGRNHTLSSITTYQNIVLAFEDIDFPGFFHSFVDGEIGEKLPPQEVWSQEFRINSIETDSNWQYTGGLFGFTQNAFEPSTNIANELTDTEADFFQLPRGTNLISKNEGFNRGLAVFGEFSVKLNEQLEFTGGLRYDYEEREATFNSNIIFLNGDFIEPNPEITEKGDYSAISPKAAISFTPNENSNIYASYTRGFRAGGINAQRLPEGIDQTFDPEYSNNFELGYKVSSPDNRFRLGAAAFYIDWTDIQFFNLIAPSTFARENVGDARSMGLELETSYIPVNGLQLDASFGYTKTEYQGFLLRRTDPENQEEVLTDISGNSLGNTPEYTFFLGTQYTASLSKGLKGTLRGEVRSLGNYYTDIQNTLEQPSYTLLNARATLEFKNYTLAFWGQNLTDKTYLAFGNADTSFGSRNVRTAAPLTFGSTLTYRF
ncbi:TonB-dependent receptor [Flagellimonas sp. HMM57]|uniref:TonB-dependent receptor n=1 Tax=unclassified Flagellimonas TaxID=2644544 RepID=UPI0013D64554|nr:MULTISPECIES: TonB-dependent receptor [unclassified Flagellimonas]UII74501.1 TonB-dependent receptor [Flagellimonas sp. HMM57]